MALALHPGPEPAAQAARLQALSQGMYDDAPVGLAFLDRDLRFVRVNAALAAVNAMPLEAHVGRHASEVIGTVWNEFEPVFRSVLETGVTVTDLEIVGSNAAGEMGNYLNTIHPVRDGDEIVGLGCFVVDVTPMRRAEALHRAVTETMVEGLYALDGQGRVTFVNAAACAMLGWTEPELRGRDAHAAIHHHRPDGAPFPDSECPLHQVREDAVRLDAVSDTFYRRDGTPLPVTYSAAPLELHGQRPGVVVVFRDATRERRRAARERRLLADVERLGEVREALDEDRLVLHAQPIVPVAGGLPSAELLVRMVGRDGQVHPPGEFLPAAERYGLITEIDRFVIERAALLAAQGRRLEVNVSAKSVDGGLLDFIAHTLERAGADPANLVFELTETALMTDIAAGERFARGLAELGCGLALDDFGTGFASLTYLTNLPVQYLKIDVSFVRDLPRNPKHRHVVRTIVSLAAGLGQQTIAEGVEDAETLTLLRELGVDFAQGFHLGRPAPATERDHVVAVLSSQTAARPRQDAA